MRSFIYLIFLGLIFSECRSNHLIPYDTSQNIKILNIDFEKFEYQTVFKFVTKKTRKIGFLFIDKREEKVIELFISKKRKFIEIELCQVNSIRVVDDLHLKRNRAGLGYYESGIFQAGFDNNSKDKYYTLCHKQLNEIKHGL
jgi:hypothetical protein